MKNNKLIKGAPNPIFLKKNNNLLPHRKVGSAFLYSDPSIFYNQQQKEYKVSNISNPTSKNGTTTHAIVYCTNNPKKGTGNPNSPYLIMFPPWTQQFSVEEYDDESNAKAGFSKHGLIGSLVYEGHIYSLAASGDFLYTGSDNKDLRVWKNLKDFYGLKSGSGLVKAIVVLGDKIFTGHQDGKIRIWRFCGDNKRNMGYQRVGSLPTTWDLYTKSINPRNYVEVKKKRSCPWIKHYDAVSCMSVDVDSGLLYSGSWDKTLKVWRISDYKCLESIRAHDDAVNSVIVAFDGLVFTGSADGTVKMWRREEAVVRKRGRKTKHVMLETLLRQEHAVTSLVVNHQGSAVVYAGSSDGLVNFWERVSGKDALLYGGVLRGHKLAVLCLAVGGNLVLSGSADKTICVWRKESGGVHTCVAVLSGHGGPVKCLAVEEDGDQRWIVYSGSLDKSVKVWRVSERGALKLKELE